MRNTILGLASAALLSIPAIGFPSDRCLKESPAGDCEIYAISLIRLLAAPERYHGKQVQVAGFVNLEFEGNAIYLHREDYERMLLANALWISVPSDLYARFQRYNPSYAIVAGTVDANRHGHLGQFAATISEVTRLDHTGSRSEIDAEIRNQMGVDSEHE